MCKSVRLNAWASLLTSQLLCWQHLRQKNPPACASRTPLGWQVPWRLERSNETLPVMCSLSWWQRCR